MPWAIVVGMPKYVFVLGAGASIADVVSNPAKSRPPLDRGFFGITARVLPRDLRLLEVRNYFDHNYGLDVCAPEHDSVEGVMSRLYPDMFNALLEKEALSAFRCLLRIFTQRLAETTNAIRPTQRRLLYRMLSRLLANDVPPSDITIVTFNQDLQVERTLEALAGTKRWDRYSDQLLSFPGMYSVPAGSWEAVTGPSGGGSDRGLFKRGTERDDCLRVLKLHGSLNWYSRHTSSTPSRAAMLNPGRRLSVTRRRTIAPDMTLSKKRTVYTLPVVVPPVNHKTAVVPEVVAPLWTLAEKRLSAADEIVVFGYSCPALDFESANLLTRAQMRRPEGAAFSVIDPNGAIATRYISLLKPTSLTYYASASAYLARQ